MKKHGVLLVAVAVSGLITTVVFAQPEAVRVEAGMYEDACGHFIPTRQFRRDGLACRNFVEAAYRRGEMWSHHGTACRAREGHWNFD